MNENDYLKYAIENGIIDLSHVQDTVEMVKRKELLAQHNFKIWHGKNGYWYTYLQYEDGRKLNRRKTKPEIEQVVIDYYTEKINNPRISEVFTEWNDRRLELKKISKPTHQRNIATFKRHYSEFGKKRIGDVTPEMFGAFLEEEIPKHNLTAKGFSSLKGITKGFLKRAKKLKYIQFHVEEMIDDIDVSEREFKKTVKEDYEEVFDVKEMADTINYLMENMDVKNLGILLMFVTGIRVGEMVSLKWEDFDGLGLKIRRTETRYKENGKIVYEIKDTPKTNAGIRYAVIPSDYLWIMKRLKNMTPFSEFVFMENGKRVKAYQIRNRMYTVCEHVDCYHKSPHKIRKTYGSILLDNQLDQKLITGQMGHTNILCTENHYHRNRRDIQQKFKMLSDIDEFKRFDSGKKRINQ